MPGWVAFVVVVISSQAREEDWKFQCFFNISCHISNPLCNKSSCENCLVSTQNSTKRLSTLIQAHLSLQIIQFCLFWCFEARLFCVYFSFLDSCQDACQWWELMTAMCMLYSCWLWCRHVYSGKKPPGRTRQSSVLFYFQEEQLITIWILELLFVLNFTFMCNQRAAQWSCDWQPHFSARRWRFWVRFLGPRPFSVEFACCPCVSNCHCDEWFYSLSDHFMAQLYYRPVQ